MYWSDAEDCRWGKDWDGVAVVSMVVRGLALVVVAVVVVAVVVAAVAVVVVAVVAVHAAVPVLAPLDESATLPHRRPPVHSHLCQHPQRRLRRGMFYHDLPMPRQPHRERQGNA